MLSQLLPIQSTALNEEALPTVNARDLHTFLGVGKDFSNWIKDRIQQHEFVEDQDVIVFAKFGENPKGGRPAKDYALTLDAAKHIAMSEHTPKGREARQYFIQCEKEYRRMVRGELKPKVPTLSERYLNGNSHETVLADFKLLIGLNQLSPGMDANQSFLGAVGQMEVMGVQLRPLLAPQALALESPHRCAELRPTDMARRFGILRRDGKEDPAAVNRLLADRGYQTRTAKETLAWTPTDKGWPFAVVKDVPRATVQGGRPVRQLFWKDGILECIAEALTRLGTQRMIATSNQFSLSLQ
ncbi:antA/AntB antirepressor family protein [Acidithiobacillus ferriphilus]|uniref:antA/AntB antirepressor family protein n=1 Tax=Acidithiobacillus ferriphilus TaxID=1689834 RepID=UPI001C069E70|nr:antA/AntB antirepressor family protein [Acidithiobacillus ferriphilus]MBU2853364.1 phage antirepressor Ant [Acidithiobacillus ferriphilus]